MNVQLIRKEIAKVYGPASAFSRRLDRMSDNQVIAIYYRMKKAGQLK